jgi:3-deoxy-D-manno-octulosonic acid kinase
VLIVYDADRLQHPDVSLFDPECWRRQDRLAGEAVGRGSAYFIDAPFGRVVLREYLRGGLPGRLIRARYLFTGWAGSRPLAEYYLLEKLFEEGLPVPAPVAALVRRHGLSYAGSLITLKIDNTATLADRLIDGSAERAHWQAAGRCIRRFHDKGVVHADLNARNILVDDAGEIYLIDFDRARIRPGEDAAFARNIARLQRSLEKLRGEAEAEVLDTGWRLLLEAYRGGGAAHATS